MTTPLHPRWFKVALVNHNAATGVLSKPGATAKWLTRRARLTNLVTGIAADVIGGIECGAGKLALNYLDDRYEAAGYERVPAGRGGRHLWVRPTFRPTAFGYYAPPRYKGDDRPAPWVVGLADGSPAMVVLSHLEFRDKTGSWNVKQQRYIIDQAHATAKRLGVPRANIVWLSDTASDNRVRREAFEHAGYRDAFDVAAKRTLTSIKSYNEYKDPRPGPRVDVIAVHNSRPVRAVSQRLTKLTDHHVQAAVIERQRVLASGGRTQN